MKIEKQRDCIRDKDTERDIATETEGHRYKERKRKSLYVCVLRGEREYE